jgi:protein-S-isoprenylcysteine O-methyltransferase Ste14
MFKRLELLLPPMPLMIVLCAVIWGLAMAFPMLTFSIPSALEWALAFYILGFAFVLPAAISFFKAKTTVDPRTPEKSNTLVITGLYKVSRNPMYLGFLFCLLASSFLFSHILGFVISILFIPYMNSFQISLEEQHLKKAFGQQYTLYCQSVRRWL